MSLCVFDIAITIETQCGLKLHSELHSKAHHTTTRGK